MAEYRPLKIRGNLRTFFDKFNNKNIILTASVISIVLVLSVVSSVSGLATQIDSEKTLLETELALATEQRNQCGEDVSATLKSLKDCKDELDLKNDELSMLKTDYAGKKSEIDSLRNDLNSCSSDITVIGLLMQKINASLVGCENDKTLIQDQLQQLQSSYDKLASSSAKIICCRPGDLSSQWGISGNSIICTGNRTVTC